MAAWLLMVVAPFGAVSLLAQDAPGWADATLGGAALLGLSTAFMARRRALRLAHEVRRRLDTLDRCTPDLLFESDASGVITYVNHRSMSILGREPAALIGRRLRDFTEGDMPALDSPLPAGDEMTTWDTRWRHASGEPIPLTTIVTPIDGRGARGVRGVVRDERDRLEAERVLRESEDRFRAAVDAARNGLMLVAGDGRLTMTNEALRVLLGRGRRGMEGLTIADIVPPTHVDQFLALIASRTWSDAAPSQYELQLQSATGAALDVEVTLSPVRESGRETCMLVEVRDLTESHRASETIRRMADYDRLTGLPNRELFDRHVQRALIDARHQGRSVAVLMLDVDRFKLINDTLGHTSGDRLLRAVAERLASHVPPQHLLARFGGDEFLLLAPDLGGRAGAEGIATAMLAAFREPFDHDGHQLKVSVSIGVAVATADRVDESADSGADADLLIRIADAAVHQAKEHGRDAYVVGSEAASDPARLRLALETDLRAAMGRSEFAVHYQPQVDARTGRTVAVEALLRWQHPQRGCVPPTEFVPLLEETGLIVEVGAWVLRTACREVQQWFVDGGRRVRVAVNLSPRQLLVPNFGDLVRDVLAETGLPAEALELELTETAAILDVESVLAVVRDLQALGVTTAIDDFGVGESWLLRLSNFPVHTLKVDRYFIAGIARPGNALAIVEAMIALGHALGLVVIAEGVETEAQLNALRAAGCDLVQGFYYARALPSAECAQFVDRTAA